MNKINITQISGLDKFVKVLAPDSIYKFEVGDLVLNLSTGKVDEIYSRDYEVVCRVENKIVTTLVEAKYTLRNKLSTVSESELELAYTK